MENREEIKTKLQSMSQEELIDLLINRDELANKNSKLEQENNWYREQIAMLKKARFSSSSEQTIAGQLNLFNEVEDVNDHPVEEIAEPVKKSKKKKQREADFSKLPTRIIEHEVEDKHCAVCGNDLRELAPQTIDVLKYQPARYVVERHIVHQYVCPVCTEENLEAEITIAEGAPRRLIKGSVTSPSVVAGIVFNKYVSGTPLYRQEQELKRKKIEISRATMSNWLMKCGEKLEPLYIQMQEDIRKQTHIHMDETTVVVLEDKQATGRSKSYMWVVESGKHEKEQIAWYQYHETREHEIAKEILGADYRGSIHCDGYEAYHKFEQAKVIGCMAHLRRKFVEALEVSPLHKGAKKMNQKQLKQLCDKNPSYGNIQHVLGELSYLFHCESRYQKEGYTIEEIKEHRQEEQKSRVDEIFKCFDEYKLQYSVKSKMGVAIQYAKNRRNI